MVEPEDVGVKVALEVLGADNVVNAVDAPLGVAPEPFDIVSMGAARHVLLGAVGHGFMGITKTGKAVVSPMFVGVDRRIVGVYVLLEHRDDGSSLAIGFDFHHGSALAFNHPHHNGLADGSPTSVELLRLMLVGFLPADVSFVNLYLSEQGGAVLLGHQLADLGEHPPSRLVGDTGFPLQLLGGYAGPGRGHEEHRVEPSPQGSGGLVKDGVCRGGDVVAAELTGVDLAPRDPVVVRNLLALLASNTGRPSCVLEEVQAGILVWKLLLEVLYCVLFHATSLSEKVRDVKG